jgi:hypothetical protein
MLRATLRLIMISEISTQELRESRKPRVDRPRARAANCIECARLQMARRLLRAFVDEIDEVFGLRP